MSRYRTVAERRHLDAVAALGCIVCDVFHNRPGTPATIHHIRDGYGMGQRAPDAETIPLCGVHHQTGGHGVAYHAGAETWVERYAPERELLELVRQRLAHPSQERTER